MSLECYDKGVLDYLKSHLNFPNIVNSSDDTAFNYSADENSRSKDLSIALPMISFWRISNNLINESGGNFRGKHEARVMSKDIPNKTAHYRRELEIVIDYQITIWASTRKVCDDIFRELAMLLVTDCPYIPVYIPGLEYPEKFDLIVTDTDTSIDLSEFSDKGRIYRQNLTIELPDAKLVFTKDSPLVTSIPLVYYTFDSLSTDIDDKI